jgi:hypothetical protein
MEFILNIIDASQMQAILLIWLKKFNKKAEKNPKIENACLISEQMLHSATHHRHGYYWLAQNGRDPAALLLADDHGRSITICFLLADILKPEIAKGAGRFLVEEMLKLTTRNHWAIHTTSQRANRFWKNCPPFIESPPHSGEFIALPEPTGTAAKETSHKSKRKGRKPC